MAIIFLIACLIGLTTSVVVTGVNSCSLNSATAPVLRRDVTTITRLRVQIKGGSFVETSTTTHIISPTER